MSRASARGLLGRRRGQLLVGAAIGTGMAANFAMRGGADFLLALNAGRLRSMGEPSVTSMTAVNEANAFTLDFACREILPRAQVPVIFGACCFDPRQDMAALVARITRAGFDGVSNFPTATMLGGQVRDTLERLGLGFCRELEMLTLARRAGLLTLAYTHTQSEAEAAARAGVDLLTIGLGWNHGGALASADQTDVRGAIEEAAIHFNRIARAVASLAPDTICLVEGGPIVSPRHLEELCRFVNIDGYIGGSTIDRVPLETAIEDTTSSFKTIAASATTPVPKHSLFPLQFVGRSEAIRDTRDQFLRLAETEIGVNLDLPKGADAEQIIHSLHGLSRRRHKKLQVLLLDRATMEDRMVDLFGQPPGQSSGGHNSLSLDTGRGKIGILELLSGGTLGLICTDGLPSPVVHDIAFAIRREQGQQIGGMRSFNIDVRLVVTNAPLVDVLPGLATLVVPPLSQRPEDVPTVLDTVLRALRRQLRRPLLRLDAAAWRLVVDHTWPGDVEGLHQAIRTAALAIQGDTITPMDLPSLRPATVPHSLFASEKEWIIDGLRRNRFNRTDTARFLGVSRKTLYNKIRRYALDRSAPKT